ncbi:MAG: hypothetical protein HWN65_02885 [Candidatus Helarchaeota archaeon]|nr:hypothetical protein [Candidatus Helarchaeota archaeon]
MKELSLKVADIEKEWAFRGRARIHIDVIPAHGMRTGDIIKIIGEKNIGAILVPNQRETPKDIIQMDDLQRSNAGVEIDDMVKIERIIPSFAQKIVIAPVKDDRSILSMNSLQSLLNRPVREGEIIPLINQVSYKKKKLNFHYQQFLIKETNPKGIVQVKEKTKFEISPRI